MKTDRKTDFRVPAQTLTDRTDRPRAQLYVISTQAIVDRVTMNSRRDEHIAYLHELDRSGRLAGAGPILSADEAFYDGHGIIILLADSAVHATELARADPFHMHGLRSFTVTAWLLSEGILHDSLLSDEFVVTGKADIEDS